MTDRFHRQELLPGVGSEGQRRLASSHAVVVGVGALGCTIADLLARAGVGRLTLIDRDLVEVTNLQRQSLFTETDAAERRAKAEAAGDRLAQVNSGITVAPVVADLVPANAEQLVAGATILLDGTDNFETRFLLNDLAVKLGVPFVYCGAVGWRGAGMVVRPGKTPCLRCLFDGPPADAGETCDTAGVAGPVAVIAAANAAAEAMKLMLGADDHVADSLLEFDLWRMQRRRLRLADARRDDCPCCVQRRFDFLGGASGTAAALCGQDAVQVPAPGPGAIDLERVSDRLAQVGPVYKSRFMVRGRVEAGGRELEITVFGDGRAIVAGTTDPALARSAVARYLGR